MHDASKKQSFYSNFEDFGIEKHENIKKYVSKIQNHLFMTSWCNKTRLDQDHKKRIDQKGSQSSEEKILQVFDSF